MITHLNYTNPIKMYLQKHLTIQEWLIKVWINDVHVFVCTYTQRTFCYWHTHTFTHLISPAQTLSYCNIQPFCSDGWFLWITNISKLLASHQLHKSHQFLGRNFIDNHTSTVSIIFFKKHHNYMITNYSIWNICDGITKCKCDYTILHTH